MTDPLHVLSLFLQLLDRFTRQKREAVSLEVYLKRHPKGRALTPSERNYSNMFLIAADGAIAAAIQPVDKFGNVAPVENVAWLVSPSEMASIAVGPDGMSAVVVPNGILGTFQISVSADAKIGDGVKPLVGMSEDIQVVAGEAATLKINLTTSPN